MTEKGYALTIYELIFQRADYWDANVQGIFDAINTLTERERIALESRYRYRKIYREIAKDIGVKSVGVASSAVNKAILKLRHPSRSRKMRLSSMKTEEKAAYIVSTEKDIKNNIVDCIIKNAFFALDRETHRDEGVDYKSLYYGLYKGITHITRNVTTYDETIAALHHLQALAEEAYIEQGE